MTDTPEAEDHVIPAIRADQAMQVLAMAVCIFINEQAQGDIKRGQVQFAIFVRQLSSFSKEPATIAKLLRICADELDGKLDDPAPEEPKAL